MTEVEAKHPIPTIPELMKFIEPETIAKKITKKAPSKRAVSKKTTVREK